MNAGSVLAQFTVKLTKPATEPVAVLWRTADGTAKAGVDYAAAAGTVNFAVGEDTKTLEVLVYGRAVGSENRTFSVLMLPPGNAILGQSVAECIISVDTSGSTPVIDIILPDGSQGQQGKSAYQSWLDTGHTGTEADFVNWLRPTPEEIAEEIAPQINVGDSTLTTKDTENLGHPDKLDVKTLSKRVAYADGALIATVVLGDGHNTIQLSDFTGDAIDFRSPFISFRISHNGVLVDADWSVNDDDKLIIHSATAGDVLYGVEYRINSKRVNLLTEFATNLSDEVKDRLRKNIDVLGRVDALGRVNPFSEIKDDGTAAVEEALSNLRLGSGAPAIGIPFFWPSAAMPNTVMDEWSDMVFLKWNGATFSATEYPKLALIIPALKLQETRGEFIRVWDDGRGVDIGRTLLSAQQSSKLHEHVGQNGTMPSLGLLSVTNSDAKEWDTGWSVGSIPGFSSSSSGSDLQSFRPRNISFNFLVRAK